MGMGMEPFSACLRSLPLVPSRSAGLAVRTPEAIGTTTAIAEARVKRWVIGCCVYSRQLSLGGGPHR